MQDWFSLVLWELHVDKQHTHFRQKLYNTNSAKSVLHELRAHNWIKIQGYFSWGQQRHILGS